MILASHDMSPLLGLVWGRGQSHWGKKKQGPGLSWPSKERIIRVRFQEVDVKHN